MWGEYLAKLISFNPTFFFTFELLSKKECGWNSFLHKLLDTCVSVSMMANGTYCKETKELRYVEVEKLYGEGKLSYNYF